jgi:hypothetical protein
MLIKYLSRLSAGNLELDKTSLQLLQMPNYRKSNPDARSENLQPLIVAIPSTGAAPAYQDITCGTAMTLSGSINTRKATMQLQSTNGPVPTSVLESLPTPYGYLSVPWGWRMLLGTASGTRTAHGYGLDRAILTMDWFVKQPRNVVQGILIVRTKLRPSKPRPGEYSECTRMLTIR